MSSLRRGRSSGLTVPVDVSDAEAIEDAAARIERELGPIDVWVNNAMVPVLAPLTDMPAADFRRVTDVPPISQPEVAAGAIVWAAKHPRREHWVAWPTARAIVANRIVPGLLDRYLARTGFDAQQTDHALEPGRPDNLYDPVPGDRGARGEFDDRSKATSASWWLTRNRRGVVAAGAVLLALFGLGRRA